MLKNFSLIGTYSTGLLVIGLMLAVGAFSVPASAQLIPSDAPHTLVAEKDIKVEDDAEVFGDVHANDKVEVKSKATVFGDVTAGEEIKNEGTIVGSVTEGVADVMLPAFDADDLRAMADLILDGDQEFSDEVIDDVVFVDGKATIKAGVSGQGMILAESDIIVEAEVGDQIGPTLVAVKDVKIEKGKGWFGTVVSGKSVKLEDDAILQGRAFAHEKVEVKKKARVVGDAAEPPPDIAKPFVLVDGDSEIYRLFVAVAGDDIKVDKDSVVTGNIHSNDKIDVKKDSLVAGDASAVGEIKGDGTITGSSEENAEALTLPVLPSALSLQALADRTFSDQVTFTDATIDDVVFVFGKVEIKGSLLGGGTIIATDEIRFKGSPGVIDPEAKLSLISYDDIKLDKDWTFRGALRAARDIKLEKNTAVTGVAIADGKIDIKKEADLSFELLRPVSIEFTAPPAVVINDTSPQIVLVYSAPAGLNLGSFSLRLGEFLDLTNQCSVGPQQAVCEPSSFDQGPQELIAEISDLEGRVGTARLTVEVLVSDSVAPILSLIAPIGTVDNDPTPLVRFTYQDAEAGVDLLRIQVQIDGQDILGSCVLDEEAAECQSFELSEGAHVLTITVGDRVGNAVVEEYSFDVDLDREAPSVSIDSPSVLLINEPQPAIEISWSDSESDLDLNSFSLELDGIDLGPGCVSSATAASCQSPVLGAGSHLLIASIADIHGNESSASRLFELVLDNAAPNLEVTAPTGMIFDSTPEIRVAFEDLGTGPDLDSLSVELDGSALGVCTVLADIARCETPELAPGEHHITASLADQLGNTASAAGVFTVVVRDREAPEIVILAPAVTVTGNSTPAIHVSYSDASGVDTTRVRLSLDQIELTSSCQVSAVEATCQSPPLAPGEHILKVEARDLEGNRAEIIFPFSIRLELAITIEQPASGFLTFEDRVVISGSAEASVTGVSIAGVAATLQSGQWSAEVDLHEGANTLTAVAVNGSGGSGSASVAVVLDTEPPRPIIFTPRSGSVSHEGQIFVAGEIVDPVSSVTAAASPIVLVNGQEAIVEQRAFELSELLLQAGLNIIEVRATDAAGNTGSAEIEVHYNPNATQRIEKLLGDHQESAAGSELPLPLTVRLVTGDGVPLAGRQVSFDVSRGNGRVQSFPDSGRSLLLRTDEQGLAQVSWTLGDRTGRGNHQVTVTSPGFQDEAVFSASATSLGAVRIRRIVGNNQTGAQVAIAGSEAPYPLLTQVFDALGNPVAGVSVIYQAIAGGGDFADLESATAITDSDGKAGVIFTLGPELGPNTHRVEAFFAGLDEPSAIFTFSGLAPGDGPTRLVGVVLDNQDEPVPGVTLHVGDVSATSDAEGRFVLDGVPAGLVHLEVDGSTTSRPGDWPHLAFELVAITGQDNSVGMPIRLLPIDSAGGREVGGPQDVTVGISGVPGAEVTVFANSATFPDGSKVGQLSMTQVHGDKVPMVAPLGSNFMLAWTLQPPGVRFDPPARISIPNLGGEPGAVVDIFSFDHDLGEFIIAGTAAVSDDGLRLVSTPGSGIAKTGWGGCAPPPPPGGDACSPGICFLCVPGERQPVPKCTPCERCNGQGECEKLPKLKVGEVTARADGEEVRAVTGKDTSISFTAELTGDCEGDTEYAWDFGDGNTSSEASPDHSYMAAGTYMASVTVSCNACASDDAGSDDVEVVVVKVDVEIQGLPEEGSPNEDDPGAFLGVPAMGTMGSLIPVKVSFEGAGVSEGEMRLDASGSSRLQFFEDPGRGTAVSLPKTWPITSGNLSRTLYMEAIKASDAYQDIELDLSYEAVADDQAKVTAIGVEIEEPMDMDVHLEGEQISWLAKPMPPSIPGQTPSWEFEYTKGMGMPLTGAGDDDGGNRKFDSTVSANFTDTGSDEVELKVTLTVAGINAVDQRKIKVIEPKVVAVSFVADIPLTNWVFNNMGMAIVDPVWEKSLTSTDVTKNEAVAYMRSKPGLDHYAQVLLSIEGMEVLSNNTTIEVRGVDQGTTKLDFERSETIVKDWMPTTGGIFLLSKALKDTNNSYRDLTVKWEYRVRKLDDTYTPWEEEAFELGITSHRLYTTFELPITSPVFDKALDRATFYAPDENTIESIALALTDEIDVELFYDPTEKISVGLPLNAYKEGKCLCYNNAELLQLLAASVGISGDLAVFYGGQSTGTALYFNLPRGGKATTQFKNPKNDDAPKNAHFVYHVQTIIGGIYYDPSFSKSGPGRATSLHECDKTGLVPPATLIEAPIYFGAEAECMWTDRRRPH